MRIWPFLWDGPSTLTNVWHIAVWACCPLYSMCTLSEEFWNQSAPCELFTVQHQKGITYLRLLISNPSVKPVDIWNLITLNKWGGGQHKSFYFHLSRDRVCLEPDQGEMAEKVGSLRAKVTIRRREREIWSDTWRDRELERGEGGGVTFSLSWFFSHFFACIPLKSMLYIYIIYIFKVYSVSINLLIIFTIH